MFKKNKSSLRKRSYIHKNQHKKISNQQQSRAALRAVPVANTCKANAESALPATSVHVAPFVAARKSNFRKKLKDNSTMHSKRTNFQKFKDDHIKKPLKRLKNRKPKQNNCSYSQKLANSIKRRAFNSFTRNTSTSKPLKRKLEFQGNTQRQLLLPKRKFYRSKQSAGSRNILNTTMEEGEVIEEIESSDDDDCIILDPDVSNKCLDDNTNEVPPIKTLTTSNEDDNIPSCSHFEVDTKPERQLFDIWSKRSGRGFVYPGRYTPLSASNDSCIVLDDSYDNRDECSVAITDDRQHPNMSKEKLTQKQKSTNSLDDSVIIIEESFIPLPTDDKPKKPLNKKYKRWEQKKLGDQASQKKQPVENNVGMGVNPPKMYRQRMSPQLFTTTERKKLADYNSNTYNPDKETGADEPISNKRSIIIDGSNVAFGHGCSNMFSSEGIKYCVEYFQKMGHDVKAVIPLFRRNATKSTNPEILDQLHRDGKIVFTPCKNLPNQQSISYDDRFILQLAYERNAAVVSNDNYRDLIHENPAFKKIIENRVIGYSWCDNILILPKDPYGRFGPQLDEILRC
ncbi:uncharacterized protein LOC6559395 isoform X2 [Drosophila grimshawi]|uniref:uncharacterized protein LOC6559395 isoform X2 n=1 Tax=Drosophila grimshawi TaxID=7222 RepID=UPI000C86FDF2|nr:uncharacterized protein LOC6559395 isoform X2 [Drosophila grimshawi]